MGPQIFGPRCSDIFKDVTSFRGFTSSKSANNIPSSPKAPACTNDSSNSDTTSRKHLESELSVLVGARRIGKMDTTDASTTPSRVSPKTGESNSLASSSFCSSAYSTPREVGVAIAVAMPKVGPDTATAVNYKPARAHATVTHSGSPIPRKLVGSGASSSVRAGLGPTMRTSRDAYQVIMGEHPTFPPRTSSLPISSPSTVSRNVSDKASVVSRISRHTASSAARTVNTTIDKVTTKSTHAVKASSGARSTSATKIPNAVRSTSAAKTPISTRSTSATKSTTATRSSSTTGATRTARPIDTTRATSAIRLVNSTRTASAARSAKPMKPTSVTRTASVKRVVNSKAPTRPIPRYGTMNSLKSASKGFKSRISAMMTNRRRLADAYQDGSGQELSPLVGKDSAADSVVENPGEKLVLSPPSSLPRSHTSGDDVDSFISMSRDQLDRLVQAAQGIHNKEKREGAMEAVNAYGQALVAVNAARKANMDLSAAIVSLSRQATDLGSQALALIQD